MKILITGVCGFIGTNIALAARKKKYEVFGMDSLIRKKTEENILILEKAGVHISRGDVRNKEDFDRIQKVDAVIHLAANPGIPWSIQFPVYDFDTNVGGTINVLEFARKNGEIPVIFASTNKVYSNLINTIPNTEQSTRYEFRSTQKTWITGTSKNGINEQFPVDGFGKYSHSPYGVSKLSADLYCQEYFQIYNVPTVINRMSCVYGYYQKGVSDQGWIDHFIKKVLFEDRKITIFGNGKQVRDMVWGEDLASLYLLELENIDKVKGQVFNIGGGIQNTLSLLEAVTIIEKLSKKNAVITYDDWRHADQKIYISDINKIKQKIGWTPTISPEEGIRLMFQKYKSS